MEKIIKFEMRIAETENEYFIERNYFNFIWMMTSCLNIQDIQILWSMKKESREDYIAAYFSTQIKTSF